MGLGVGFTNYFNKNLGLNLNTDVLFASASAPQTTSMSISTQFNFGLNFEVAFLNIDLKQRLIQAYFFTGAYYTTLKWAGEFSEFVENNSYQMLTTESASGPGYTFGIGGRSILETGFNMSIDLFFAFEKPKFPRDDSAFDGQSFGVKIGIGFKPPKK